MILHRRILLNQGRMQRRAPAPRLPHSRRSLPTFLLSRTNQTLSKENSSSIHLCESHLPYYLPCRTAKQKQTGKISVFTANAPVSTPKCGSWAPQEATLSLKTGTHNHRSKFRSWVDKCTSENHSRSCTVPANSMCSPRLGSDFPATFLPRLFIAVDPTREYLSRRRDLTERYAIESAGHCEALFRG